jgi:hypothetical protein
LRLEAFYPTVRRALGASALLAGMLTCHPATTPPGEVPALRFAGVDLVYALRRVAAEAHLVLILDEVRPSSGLGHDLARHAVDVDLPAGPVQGALDPLTQLTSDFQYRVDDGVLIVQSRRAQQQPGALDTKDLPAAQLEVDLYGLLEWLRSTRPRTLLATGELRRQPVFQAVKLSVPANSSAVDVIAAYARALGSGVHLQRAEPAQSEAGEPLVATSISLWSALDAPVYAPDERPRSSAISGLANLARRTQTRLCVLDRTAFFDQRGYLNFAPGEDPELALAASLDTLETGPEGELFVWEESADCYRVRSDAFEKRPLGRGLLGAKLRAGSFQGSLAELARWINANRLEPSDERLLGGELDDAAPTAQIDVAEGTQVEELLRAFASASGEGWNYVVRAVEPGQELRDSWTGAYLTRLAAWVPDTARE